jgi:transcriptional regulator with XRE-family HTH domain
MKEDLSDRYELLQRTLIKAREDAGLSQQEVARALGKHQTFVSKVERGERKLDVIEFIQMAKVLNFDPHILIKRLQIIKQRR